MQAEQTGGISYPVCWDTSNQWQTTGKNKPGKTGALWACFGYKPELEKSAKQCTYVDLNKHTAPPIAVQYMRIVSKCSHKSAKHSYAKQWLAPATKYHRGMYVPNLPTVKNYWHTQQRLFLGLSKLWIILLQLSLHKSDPDSNECHEWVFFLLTSFNNKLAERLLWELRRGRWRFALPRRLLLAHFWNAKCVTCISDKTYCIQSMV